MINFGCVAKRNTQRLRLPAHAGQVMTNRMNIKDNSVKVVGEITQGRRQEIPTWVRMNTP